MSMAGMMRKDTSGDNHVPLNTSREPIGPKSAGDKGTMGDEAWRDAVAIVAVAWVVLFLLTFSLRGANI